MSHMIIEVVNGGSSIEMSRCPKKVWTILDQDLFDRIGPVHWRSAFLEDKMHDWDWKDGWFRFYGHSGEPGDTHRLCIEFDD